MSCEFSEGESMFGIPSKIHHQLCTTLLHCGPFNNDNELRAIFADARISPWRDRLPKAVDSSSRVTTTIDFLFNRYNDTQENALVLFLCVLSEQISPGDSCHHNLARLASSWCEIR